MYLCHQTDSVRLTSCTCIDRGEMSGGNCLGGNCPDTHLNGRGGRERSYPHRVDANTLSHVPHLCFYVDHFHWLTVTHLTPHCSSSTQSSYINLEIVLWSSIQVAYLRNRIRQPFSAIFSLSATLTWLPRCICSSKVSSAVLALMMGSDVVGS